MTTTTVRVHTHIHPENGWEDAQVLVTKPDGSWGGGVYFNRADSTNRVAAEEVALAKALRLEKAGKAVGLQFTAAKW